jgi:hypothetical protein
MREYQKLAELNPKLAEKLRKTLGLKNVPPPTVRTAETKGYGIGIGSGGGGGGSSGTYR